MRLMGVLSRSSFLTNVRRILSFALALLLASCAGDASQRAGFQYKVIWNSKIILTSKPLVIKAPAVLNYDQELAICLILSTGVEYIDDVDMEANYGSLIHSAKPLAIASGPSELHRFSVQHQAWTKYGRVSDGGELLVCLGPDARLERSANIEIISLESDQPLEIFGAYLSSTPKH